MVNSEINLWIVIINTNIIIIVVIIIPSYLVFRLSTERNTKEYTQQNE